MRKGLLLVQNSILKETATWLENYYCNFSVPIHEMNSVVMY